MTSAEPSWPTPAIQRATNLYHELLARGHYADVRDRLAEATQRFDLRVSGKPFAYTLRPAMIDGDTYRRANEAARLVARGVQLATERLLIDEALRGELGVADLWKNPFFGIDREHGKHSVLTRVDGVLQANGEVAFVEYNPAPGALAMRWELDLLFGRLPIRNAIGERFEVSDVDVCHDFTRALSEVVGEDGDPRPARIARLRVSPNIGAEDFYGRWLPYLAAHGATVMHANLEEFRLEGDDLYVGDQRIDLLIPKPFQELFRNPKAARPLIHALGQGTVRAFFGISRGAPSGNKAVFELLSDPQHAAMFDDEVRVALERHVPWTRVLRPRKTSIGDESVDLLEYVESHQHDLVIKPSSGTGGQDVLIGRDCSATQWRERLDLADGGASTDVVQALVEAVPLEFPVVGPDGGMELETFTPDHCPFVFGDGSANCCHIRLGRARVSNFARGSSMSALWIVDER